MNIKFLYLFFFIWLAQVNAQDLKKIHDEKAIIEKSTQKLSFFLNKKEKLIAKLNVEQKIVSQTSLPYTFQRSVFFDDNSTVRNVTKTAGRKTRSVVPVTSDYESDGIFHSDLKICLFGHNFHKKRESVTFKYEKVFTDLKFLTPLYFNDYYPIENSEIIIDIPDWLSVDLREINFDLESPEQISNQEKDRHRYKYVINNLPGAFRYKGAPSRSKINAHLIVIPNAYRIKGEQKKLLENVDDLYSWYASLVAQVDNDNQELTQLVEELIEGKTEDREKIKSIFYWVQDNIRYIAFENGIMGFKPENCQSVYRNKYGDCKGMANLTKQMLILAGYDARLTWLGTSDIPYDYNMPSLWVDNHMICTVFLKDKKIFLDPTESYADLHNYAFRIQGQQALIEDGENYIIERIPSLKADHNLEISELAYIITNDKLKGTGKTTFKGNRKTYILSSLSAYPKNEWVESLTRYLNNNDKNVRITLKTQPNLDSRDRDFVIEYDIELDHQIIELEEELYINIESDYQFQNFEIPDKRNVPYEFSGKYFIENHSTLQIPEGWEVSYLPESIEETHKNYIFSLHLEEKNDQVRYLKKIVIKNTFLETEDFDDWNQAIKKLSAFYSDQIILSKK